MQTWVTIFFCPYVSGGMRCNQHQINQSEARDACLLRRSPRVEELAQWSATLVFVVRENFRSLAKRQFSLHHSSCATEACPDTGEAASGVSQWPRTFSVLRAKVRSVSVVEQRPRVLLPRSRTDDASGARHSKSEFCKTIHGRSCKTFLRRKGPSKLIAFGCT